MAHERETGLFAMEDSSPSPSALDSALSPATPLSQVTQAATLTTILNTRLVACSLRSRVEGLRELLTLLFFSDEFFAYTDTGDEVSLFVEEHTAQRFPEDALQASPEILRAIQIREGIAVISAPLSSLLPLEREAGYIQRYTAPLAERGLSMLYVSTFRTNLVLVDNSEHQRAYALLLDNARHAFRPRTSSRSNASTSSKGSTSSVDTLLSPIEGALKVVHCRRSALSGVTRALLRLVLQGSVSENRFLSITANGEELTITLLESDLARFSQSERALIDVNDASWRALHLGAGARGVGSAVVNEIAAVFGSNGVSIFYLSTCNDDYILVESDHFSRAQSLLKDLLVG